MARTQISFQIGIFIIAMVCLGSTYVKAEGVLAGSLAAPLLASDINDSDIKNSDAEDSDIKDSETKEDRGLWFVLSKGTILSQPKAAGKIIAPNEARTIFAEGDILYLVSFQDEFIPQKEWIAYRSIKKVYHPKNGKYLGDEIDILGIVKVIEANGKIAKAEIIRSKDVIMRGDTIASIDGLFDLNPPLEEALPGGKRGMIVEMKENRVINGQKDIVYIDLGKRDGVLPGDQFGIIHGGQETIFRLNREKIPFPERRVGSLVVLSTQDRTATAEIIQSFEPISKGDPILYLPPQ